MAHQAGAYPGFSSMKRLGVFLLPLDGMLVHRRVTPSIKFAGTHLYTWVERGTVRVKCFAQERNTMSPARARTRSARSGVERTNHEATAPPQHRGNNYCTPLFTSLCLAVAYCWVYCIGSCVPVHEDRTLMTEH